MVVERIDYDPAIPYLFVMFRNIGDGAGKGSFLIRLTNKLTGKAYQGNSDYPFAIPQPGHCGCTGGYTATLVGFDPSNAYQVEAEIYDDYLNSGDHLSDEVDRTNNSLATSSVTFVAH